MNRAVRKRAGKLRGKALKSLAKSRGSDLSSVSTRLAQNRYAEVLEWFEKPQHANASALAADIAASVMADTEKTTEEIAPRFITQDHLCKIECAAGCSWCCRQPLQVSILGAISVADYILKTGQKDSYGPRLTEYAQKLEPYQYDHQGLKSCFERCPFLGSDDRCQVYEARPVVCRAFHSTDRRSCERVIAERMEDRNVPMYSSYFGFIGVPLSGARQALSELGMDDRPVVLGPAVKLLLDDFEGVLADWLDGGDAFAEVAVRPNP